MASKLFATDTAPSADGIAALAGFRALLDHLKTKGVLSPTDRETIKTAALAQVPTGHTADEAREILREL